MEQSIDWKTKYTELLFNPDATQIDIRQAQELKRLNIPPSLFRLQRINKDNLANLTNDQIWMTTPDEFNDPFDSAMHFDLERNWADELKNQLKQSDSPLQKLLSVEEIEKLTSLTSFDDTVELIVNAAKPKLENDAIREKFTPDVFKSIIREQLRKIPVEFNRAIRTGHKICCFTERVDSIVMWGHYADKHGGMAIEYNFYNLANDEFRKNMLYPVFYVDTLFKADEFFRNAKDKSKFNNLFGVYACIQKSTEWAYEREWRLINNFGESFPKGVIPIQRPTAVYLGTKISESNKTQVVTLCKTRRITCYQMFLEPSSFRLNWRQINK